MDQKIKCTVYIQYNMKQNCLQDFVSNKSKFNVIFNANASKNDLRHPGTIPDRKPMNFLLF